MPEGDSIHRAARRLQALVGERLEVESPHPRGAVLGLVPRLDGLTLEAVEAVGKNLLLRFEGGVTLRSHLRMKGRWRVQPRGTPMRGMPWLVLRGQELEAVQWNGPVLELTDDVARRLGPDIVASPLELDAMIVRLRRAPDLPLAEALQRQDLVSGIGNMWAAEALWAVRLSPWLRVRGRRRRRGRARSRGGAPAHVGGARRPSPSAPRVPARRTPLQALRDTDPLARAGGREPHRVLVPDLPAGAWARAGSVGTQH